MISMLRLMAIVIATHAVILMLAMAAALLTPLPAAAQGLCMPWDALRAALAERYNETPMGGGILNRETALRVFVSPGGATFTIVAVHVNGRACPLVAGQDWDPGALPTPPDREG